MITMRYTLYIALCGCITAQTLASEPGEPLGPEDWAIQDSGLTIDMAFPFSPGDDPNSNDDFDDPQ